MKFIGHYGIAPDALMNSKRLSLADKAVFIALVHFANEEWQCWPSIPTLAKFACVSPRQVQKSIKHLQAEHWITGKRISNVKSCFYQLSEPDVGIQCIHDTEQQAIMRPKGTKLAATAIAASARSPMQPVLGTLAASATELNPYELPSVELKKREKERKALFSQPKEQPAQNQDKKPKHASIDDAWQANQARPEPGPEPEPVVRLVHSYIPKANHETLGQLHRRMLAAAGSCKGCRFNGGYEEGGHCTAQAIWDKDNWRAIFPGIPASCLKTMMAPAGTGGKV